MTKKNKILILIFIIVVAAGTLLPLLLGNKNIEEQEESSVDTYDPVRAEIEGGAMPCMLIEDQPKVKGAEVEQETGETKLERLGVITERAQTVDSEIYKEQTAIQEEATEVHEEVVESMGETVLLGDGGVNEQKTSEEEVEILGSVTEGDEVGAKSSDESGIQQQTESEGDNEVDESMVEEVVLGTPLYTVNGSRLPDELSNYAYSVCQQFGIEWYYPHLLCQMYQESQFDQGAISPKGDYGIMQLQIRHHDSVKQLAGVPNADVINDVYANIYCGVFLMQYYWHQCYDLNTAISAYNTGSVNNYNPDYVSQVRQWEGTLQRVR